MKKRYQILLDVFLDFSEQESEITPEQEMKAMKDINVESCYIDVQKISYCSVDSPAVTLPNVVWVAKD